MSAACTSVILPFGGRALRQPAGERGRTGRRCVAPRRAVASKAKAGAGEEDRVGVQARVSAALVSAAAPLGLAVGPAAAGGFGDAYPKPLEGIAAALVHPAAMFVLLGVSLYSGYLGLKWREARTIGGDIKALKAQGRADAKGNTTYPAGVEASLAELEGKRKELIQGKYRDRHFAISSMLLGGGVFFSLGGMLNTFSRTGKLFPGPHLYAGLIITALWAFAAALVPAMEKGDEGARNAHIALNVVNILMFISQVPTGLEIVEKVFKFGEFYLIPGVI